jgi:pullulanase-type alpha-1,6-glucosidase
MRSLGFSRISLAAAICAVGALSGLTTSCGDPEGGVRPVDPPAPQEDGVLTVHYYRPVEDYAGYTLLPSSGSPASAPIAPKGTDAFGAVFTVPIKKPAPGVVFTIGPSGAPDAGGKRIVDVTKAGNEIWVFEESPRIFTTPPAIPAEGTAIVYYRRADAAYDGWGLHAWEHVADAPTWDKPIPKTGEDIYGAYYTIKLAPPAQSVKFILHQGEQKDPGPDLTIDIATHGRRVWVGSGEAKLYTYPVAPPLIDAARAHWVTADTIAWDLAGDDATLVATKFALHHAKAGGIRSTDGQLTGADGAIELKYDAAGLSPAVKKRFPHLASYKALRIATDDVSKAAEILKGQLVVSAEREGALFATGTQIPGVLDELYGYDGPLGVTWSNGAPTLSVWAPTAQNVALRLFADGKPATEGQLVPMTQTAQGVWSAQGEPGWKGRYYLYEVDVFVPSTGKVEKNLVSDPYSLSLSTNSARSQIVDLSAQELAPSGWNGLAKPALSGPEDISLYELHVRDFSISDATVSPPNRGTFMAFTEKGSNGMKHLSELSLAGLTHVHLLPVFDITTVNENRSEQLSPPDLSGYDPDGEEQQAEIAKIKGKDGFNWGYDPYHYTVPEGSYATNPEGTARIVEFRRMVQALNQSGLRVVMDVVYNHTTFSGQDNRSVLDRIVPGYYFRLNATGGVESSTCCQNTASEHRMMGKLMKDSLITWARDYKVDGFRFDLMGHHMKSNMLEVRAALDALTPAQDGVDGSKIFLYGEGWDFGEVASNARGENATQKNMAGTGVATFNDRMRDAVRGGGPFDAGEDLRRQGFASGLYLEPNALDQGTVEQQKDRLLQAMDLIRVGLTGNLKDYTFEDRTGTIVSGEQIDYNGAPAGYTLDPQEAITYVEAHDNQTLFDILQYKLPDAITMENRVRMQNLAVSLTALGQGVPFFHAGIEMLRSKSMDRDSYDSGDWFNRLDFTYTSNNFGVGLPIAEVNEKNWSVMKPILADAARKPAQSDILRAVSHMREVMKIRKSSPLLRLTTGEDVKARVRFYNTGKDQAPGLVVMVVSDEVAGAPDLDPGAEAVVILFNAAPDTLEYTHPDFAASVLALHPVQLASEDATVKLSTFTAGKFSVPGRTAAVFTGMGNFPMN